MEIDSARTVRSQVTIPTVLFGALDPSGASCTDRAFGDHVLLVGRCKVVIVENSDALDDVVRGYDYC